MLNRLFTTHFYLDGKTDTTENGITKNTASADPHTMDMTRNFDLSNIVTPVKVGNLVKALREANYDEKEIAYLDAGFSQGFDIGYKGPKNRQSTANNILLKVGNKIILWNKLIKKVKAEWVAGPFDEIPFENYIESPIGLVPKAGNSGQTRLIFHLSYDFGGENEEKSLNYHTPKEDCSVTYKDLDDVVRHCIATKSEGEVIFDEMRLSDGNNNNEGDQNPIFLGKSDIKSAFRLVPLSMLSWAWLVMAALNPKTRKWQYFIDKCLPFGASISCAIFQRFSDALRFIIQFRTSRRSLTNYLDDFLFIAYSKKLCNDMISKFVSLCKEVGVPLAFEKTEWVSTQIVFLGILLDGARMILGIPEDKCHKVVNMLNKFMEKKKTMVKDLQALCSYLNFLTKAIHPGRTFLRRMYSKYGSICGNGKFGRMHHN